MSMPEWLSKVRKVFGKGPLLLASVTGLVRNSSGGLLLVRKQGAEDWTLPGGLMDLGESPIKTVIREVKEETNVRVKPRQLLGVFGPSDGFKYTYDNGHKVEYVDILYECKAINGRPFPDGEEIAETKYFTIANLADVGWGYPVPLAKLIDIKSNAFRGSIKDGEESAIRRGTKKT